MGERHVTMFDDDGNELDCAVLLIYCCIENGKNYVFYTDDNYDEEGNLNIYASRYLGEEDGEMKLEEIEDEEEWNLLDDAFEQARRGINE